MYLLLYIILFAFIRISISTTFTVTQLFSPLETMFIVTILVLQWLQVQGTFEGPATQLYTPAHDRERSVFEYAD